jgi:dihydrofolate reductase
MSVQISMIVAMTKDRVIGANNQMPWHLPADLKHFKATTMAKPIVMGRKTWESIGRPLPGRRNIVISRQADFRAEGADVFDSVTDAVALAKSLALEAGQSEIFIIGGEAIYRSALALAEKVYLTELDLSVEGDAWFPELPEEEWRETARECSPVAEAGLPAYCFVTLQRNHLK